MGIIMNDLSEYRGEPVIFPPDHEKNIENNPEDLLTHKHDTFGNIALKTQDFQKLMEKLNNLENLANQDLR